MELKDLKFDRDFFDRHQERLVRFANSWIGQRFFRFHDALQGIKGVKVCAIGENSVSHSERLTIRNDELIRERKTTFSVDRHFAMCLENAYAFIKKLIPVGIASALVDSQALVLVMGTVGTFYPEAQVASNAGDGTAKYAPSASWATVHDGAGTNAQAGTYAALACYCSGSGNNWEFNQRMFTHFYTASLPDTCVISAVDLKLYTHATNDPNDEFSANIVIVESTATATTIATSDYQEYLTTSFASKACSSISKNSNYTWSLNASGIANVSKTGVSKFAVMYDFDVTDEEPTWSASVSQRFYFYLTGNGSNKPTLTVTYSTPTIKSINGLAKADIKSINGLAIASIKSRNGLE